MKTQNTLAALALSLGLVGLPPSAFADGPHGTLHESSVYRDGFTFGFGIGGGNLSCSGDGCDGFSEAFSLDLHVGGMVQPDLAVLFDAWWMIHSEDHLSVNQGIFTAAVQYWPIQHFFLRGGLGFARSSYTYDGTFVDVSDHSEFVPAFSAAIGVEPLSTATLGIDIQLKYGTGFYSDGDRRVHNLALTVGVSFY